MEQCRTVHVGVYDTLADWETGHATAHLAGSGWELVYVGESREPVTTMGGMRVVPDLTLAELRPRESALLILPGAGEWEKRIAPFAARAREFLRDGVPVAAICGATTALAREGLLDDRGHTGAAAEVLAATGYQGGRHYREADAYTDGDLITAGPTEPVAFAREIFARLSVFPPEVLDAWYRLFKDSDPAAYATLAGEAPEGTQDSGSSEDIWSTRDSSGSTEGTGSTGGTE